MQHLLTIIQFGLIWFFSFLYFFIPAFVTYFIKGNIIVKVVAGFGTLAILFIVVWITGLVSTKQAIIQQENLDIITYAVAVSLLGVVGATISTELEKKYFKKHR